MAAAVLLPVLLCLCLVLPGSLARECSQLVSQLGDPDALDLAGFQAYVNFREIDSGLPNIHYVIASGETVQENFSSPMAFPSELQVPTASNLLPLHIKLADIKNRTLYYALSVWSLDESVSPLTACPDPDEGHISSGEDTTIAIELACSGSGSVYMQGCLTVGNSPFSLLNGTYRTLTFYFQKACDGTSDSLSCDIDTDVVPLELCITVAQAQELVRSGEGSWSLLFTVVGAPVGSRGFCLVDAFLPGGITPLLEPSIISQLPIPESFKELHTYFDHPHYMTSPIIYLLELSSQNPEVLDEPYHNDTVPGFITAEQAPKGTTVTFPCLQPGITQVSVNLTSSGFIGGTLYTESYVFEFYRDCTPRLNVSTVVEDEDTSSQLGIYVGVPVAVVIILVATVLSVIPLILLFTYKQRKKIELSKQAEVNELMDCSVYLQRQFSLANAMDELHKDTDEYNYPSLEVFEELGEGAFGRVYKARAPGLKYKGDAEFVAVKSLKSDATENMELAFVKEVKTCAQFQHDNVIRLLAICTRSPQKCMIFEYMDLGGLNDLLRVSDPDSVHYPGQDTGRVLITPDVLLHCALQVAQGLAYLASLKFVHRDVATRNCLVNHDLVIKIADFGLSREVSHSDYYRIGSAEAVLPVRWMPPEALLYGKFTVKSDVWSFGVLMWEIYTFGRQPYGGISNHEVIDRVKEGRVLDCPDLCPASVYDIMKACWIRVPSKRPKMEDILSRFHQLIGHSAEFEERYVTVTPATAGYVNLTAGVVASRKEVEESKELIKHLELSAVDNSCDAAGHDHDQFM